MALTVSYTYQMDTLVMGEGTVYCVEKVSGMGLGPARPRVYEIPGADGVEFGREWRDGKTITIEGSVKSATDALVRTAILAMETAWNWSGRTSPRTATTFKVKYPGQAERSIVGRPDKFDYDDEFAPLGVILWVATFKATMP